MSDTRATLRHLRTSPYKVREVLELIRGRDAEEARRILQFCERGPATPVLKLLNSAIANAEHNDSIPSEELFVSLAYADEGPTQKRFRTRARGRGTQILKRTSHITIGVARYDEDALEERLRQESQQGSPAARRRDLRRRRTEASQAQAAARSARDAEDHDHDHEEVELEGTVAEETIDDVVDVVDVVDETGELAAEVEADPEDAADDAVTKAAVSPDDDTTPEKEA
jgi:large subunit ribosomal protein L22